MCGLLSKDKSRTLHRMFRVCINAPVSRVDSRVRVISPKRKQTHQADRWKALWGAAPPTARTTWNAW